MVSFLAKWNNWELAYGQRDIYDNIELTGDGSFKIPGDEGISAASDN